jgi:glutamate-1-semialdehyde 2,1-aminomutase
MDAAQRSFISSTFWTERLGPVAALATIRKHRDRQVAAHLIEVGTAVQRGWRRAAHEAGLPIEIDGIPPLSHFSFVNPESAMLTTLFIQLMLDRGFLASAQLYASYAHQPEHVTAYLAAVDEVFDLIGRAESRGDTRSLLRGDVKHSGFERLT